MLSKSKHNKQLNQQNWGDKFGFRCANIGEGRGKKILIGHTQLATGCRALTDGKLSPFGPSRNNVLFFFTIQKQEHVL